MNALLVLLSAFTLSSHAEDPHAKNAPAHGTFRGRVHEESHSTQIPFAIPRDGVYTAAEIRSLAEGIVGMHTSAGGEGARIELIPEPDGQVRAMIHRLDAPPIHLTPVQLRAIADRQRLPFLPKIEHRFNIAPYAVADFFPRLAPFIAAEIAERHGTAFPTVDFAKHPEWIRSVQLFREGDRVVMSVRHVFFSFDLRLENPTLLERAHRMSGVGGTLNDFARTVPTILISDRRPHLTDIVPNPVVAAEIYRAINTARANGSPTVSLMVNASTGFPVSSTNTPRTAVPVTVRLATGQYETPNRRVFAEGVPNLGLGLFLRIVRGL